MGACLGAVIWLPTARKVLLSVLSGGARRHGVQALRPLVPARLCLLGQPLALGARLVQRVLARALARRCAECVRARVAVPAVRRLSHGVAKKEFKLFKQFGYD